MCLRTRERRILLEVLEQFLLLLEDLCERRGRGAIEREPSAVSTANVHSHICSLEVAQSSEDGARGDEEPVDELVRAHHQSKVWIHPQREVGSREEAVCEEFRHP